MRFSKCLREVNCTASEFAIVMNYSRVFDYYCEMRVMDLLLKHVHGKITIMMMIIRLLRAIKIHPNLI